MYIYSKYTKLHFFDDLSYGYPMVMVWLSYGYPMVRIVISFFLHYFCKFICICQKKAVNLQRILC